MSRNLSSDEAPIPTCALASTESEDIYEASIDIEDDGEDDGPGHFFDELLAGSDVAGTSDEEEEPDPSSSASQEDVDLKADQRTAIDLAYEGIDEKTFYEVLLLPRHADVKAIKRGYYRLSKEYHPDKFYRKNLGGYKAKLEVIFNKLTEAYRVLSDSDRRHDYDEQVFGREDEKEQVSAKVSEASTTVTFVPEAEKRRQKQEAARRKARSEVQKKRSRPIFMQKLQKQLAQRIAKAKVAMAAGQAALDVNDWEEAASQFQIAMTFDARNTKAKMLFARAQSQHRNSKAEAFYRQAQDVLLSEDTKRAAELYQKAVDCKPTKGKYYFDFGKLIIEHTLQQKVGLELLRTAVEFEPRNVNYNLELARVYEQMGRPSKAQRTFERVLQLDKKNSEAGKALKRLR